MMGPDGSGNVLAPNLTLKLKRLLQEFPSSQVKDELSQVTYLILRNISNLRHVYHFYCTLGHNRVQSTKSEMTRLQFWRFIKDSHIHHYGLSLPEMDRIIANNLEKSTVHLPTERLSLSDFLSSITILAYVIFKKEVQRNSRSSGTSNNSQSRPAGTQAGRSPGQSHRSYILPSCLQMLINKNIAIHSGRVKGGFLFDTRRAINALKYMEGSWRVYLSLCDPSSHPLPLERTLLMRKLLFALKDFQIIGPRLSSEEFIKILSSDHPRVREDEGYNLDIEICFLEYFEALVACAVIFVDEDMIKQHCAPKPARFHTGSSSAGSGIGHPRPGSSYSRRPSAPSSRSVSPSISSIDEDGSSSSSGASTLQATEEEGAAQNVNESVESAVGAFGELQMNEHSSSPDSIDMSMIFADMENDEETVEASPRTRRSTPEVVTAEMEQREREFLTWSSKLDVFFIRRLFPAWHRNEMLRRETVRHKSKKLAR